MIGVMRRLSLLFVACLLCGLAEAFAQNAPLTPEQQAFVERYVEAVRAKDVGRLKALAHPRSLACIQPETASFYDDVFASRTRQPAGAQYAASVQTIAPGQSLMMEGDVTYPVRPTHWVQVVAERGTWLEVLPCPTPATLAKYRAAKATATTQEQRAKELVANLKDPLRGELRQLLRDGRKVSAIMRYNQEAGEDLSVARRVIELLSELKD